MTASPPSRRSVALVVALFAIVWFANLDARRLIRPDEGRYAEIAREMAVTGDWITPRLNGLKYFEKPPLQYWITAAAYRALGKDEWTARLWPAVAGALCALVVWRTGRRVFGPEAGAAAGLVFAGMLWPVANGHLNTLDMGLTFWLTLGIGAFLHAQRDEATPGQRRAAMATAWTACGLAVLSKGLIGVVLPGGAIALYVVLARDWQLLRRIHLGMGLLVLGVVAAPWFVAVSVANPEFPEFFFVREHFQRFATTVHRRYEPWWYFAPLLLAGTLPWTLLALQSIGTAWRHDSYARRFRPRLFLLAWIAFVVVFFSVSKSKLPSYILPVFGPLAWLAGDRIARMTARPLAWHAALPIPLAVGAAILAARIERYANARTPAALYEAFQPWIFAASAAMLVAALVAMRLARRDRKLAAVLALSAGGLASWQLAMTGHDALAPSFSAAQFSDRVRGQIRPDCPVYSVAAYDQTLPFYLDRTVILVAFADEMEFGLSIEPHLGVPSIEAFREQWDRATCAYAFMEPETHARLQAEGMPMLEMARDTRRVLVRHPRLEGAPVP